MSAPDLGLVFDDPVADDDVLTVHCEAPCGQSEFGPAQRNGLPASQPRVGAPQDKANCHHGDVVVDEPVNDEAQVTHHALGP